MLGIERLKWHKEEEQEHSFAYVLGPQGSRGVGLGVLDSTLPLASMALRFINCSICQLSTVWGRKNIGRCKYLICIPVLFHITINFYFYSLKRSVKIFAFSALIFFLEKERHREKGCENCNALSSRFLMQSSLILHPRHICLTLQCLQREDCRLTVQYIVHVEKMVSLIIIKGERAYWNVQD